MSPASATRFLVRAYDHDLLEVVVEAADREDAISQAERMYLAGGSIDADVFGSCGALRWYAVPIFSERTLFG
jgi:hypothetical protein